ncbi:MAG: hypothetical protein JWO05_3519 [Gemmatimonadetes bacterium]|nr:hypothetical protein [Gemmatimonadota bacterium]
MPVRPLHFLLAAAALRGTVLLAQQAPAPAASASDQQRAAMVRMKNDLRNLVVAEEMFWSKASRYSSALDSLSYTAGAGNSVTVSPLQPRGYAASVRSADLPNVVCSLFVNLRKEDIPNNGPNALAAGEGEPVCDLVKSPEATRQLELDILP